MDFHVVLKNIKKLDYSSQKENNVQKEDFDIFGSETDKIGGDDNSEKMQLWETKNDVGTFKSSFYLEPQFKHEKPLFPASEAPENEFDLPTALPEEIKGQNVPVFESEQFPNIAGTKPAATVTVKEPDITVMQGGTQDFPTAPPDIKFEEK